MCPKVCRVSSVNEHSVHDRKYRLLYIYGPYSLISLGHILSPRKRVTNANGDDVAGILGRGRQTSLRFGKNVLTIFKKKTPGEKYSFSVNFGLLPTNPKDIHCICNYIHGYANESCYPILNWSRSR